MRRGEDAGAPLPLPDGLYESFLDQHMRRRVEATAHPATIDQLDPELVAGVVGAYVGEQVRRELEDLGPEQRVTRAGEILAAVGIGTDPGPARRLRAVYPEGTPHPPRPHVPLDEGALFTNVRGEPALGSELALEMRSADRVDLLCAFVKYAGIRVLEKELADLRDRGVPIRVLTTTYMGVTERRALDVLVREFDADVRISYETASTRLHAKAWMFRRASGFDTAYVGSSNLSYSALVDGLEWNVRLAAGQHAAQIAKFGKVFDALWDGGQFTPYDPVSDAARFDRSVADEGRSGGALIPSLSGLEVRPYPHQKLMLDALDRERTVFGRHSNLLVAATGTGKTVVAALDYVRLCHDAGAQAAHQRPSLLFVAHRKEILEQSLRTFREALGDGSFGELWVGGDRPVRGHHVFASIQSLSRGLEGLRRDWEVVVVDEFHHASAATYRALLEHIQPAELLGLTATPERHDGRSVLDLFDGRIAYELRLWNALEQDLLCPFHYYGIADNTDLSQVAWSAGAYRTDALENLYTGNDARARLVLNAVQDKVLDPGRMRALGFCVSIAHAEYMAQVFTAAGIAARAICADTPAGERTEAIAALRAGRVQCLFAVDIFNEGVDIPAVDTVLMLRPTASATIFVQQLGRGLRRAPGKALLTVLDFVGHHRTEFDLSARFTAMTGASRRRLAEQLDGGFPTLPGASRIVLDDVTQTEVLAAIRRASHLSDLRALTRDLGALGTQTPLARFLDDTVRELDDVYRSNRSWTAVKLAAGGAAAPTGQEKALLNRMHQLRTVDDLPRITAYSALGRALADGAEIDPDAAWTRMLVDLLLPAERFADYAAAVEHLRSFPRVAAEIVELMEAATTNVVRVPESLGGRPGATPLLSHASYQRAELLAALGYSETLRKRPAHHREGVVHCPAFACDLFLINLHKTGGTFSPTTMYRDVPVTSTLFDWESQSTTTQASATGQRYIHHRERGTEILLAVRREPKDSIGAAPFLVLGNAELVEYSGERPIRFRWRLQRAMPTEILAESAVINVG